MFTVTSIYASSSERGSIKSVCRRKISHTADGDCLVKRTKSGGTKIAKKKPKKRKNKGEYSPPLYVEGESGQSRSRMNRRHRRAHAILPRLVGSRAHHRTVSTPRDYNRPSTQHRIVPLLDRSVERVHVDMDNLAYHCSAVTFRFELACSSS